MARNNQLVRVLKVITMLETNPAGLTVAEMHSRLEADGVSCTARTVYRDLEAIQAAYFPVTKEGTGESTSRWKLASVASVSRNIQFSYRELMALFIARNTLDTMKGSPVYEAIQGFFSRMELLLGPRAQEGLKEFNNYLGFKARPTWQSGVAQEVLDTIHRACSEGHMLEIEYRSVSGDNAGEVKPRKVGPEKLYFADSGAYLIAIDFSDQVIKHFALSRVRSAVMLDEEYESHGGSEELIRGGIGVLAIGDVQRVEIEVTEPIASYVSERRWHDSQTTTRTANGITLSMDVRINDELARWVLSLGPAATVLAPRVLTERVIEMAREIARKNGRAA